MTVKQFDKLSKKKKAVLVAQDVLLQLKAKKYIANAGHYIESDNDNCDKNLDIKDKFEELKPCTVCALGSMLLSATHLGNKLTFKDINIISSGSDQINNKNVKDLFNSIFDGNQLLLIETAFEGYSPFEERANYPKSLEYYINESDRFGNDVLGYVLNLKEAIDCTKFFRKYRNDENRLKAICNNIILNSGTFVL